MPRTITDPRVLENLRKLAKNNAPKQDIEIYLRHESQLGNIPPIEDNESNIPTGLPIGSKEIDLPPTERNISQELSKFEKTRLRINEAISAASTVAKSAAKPIKDTIEATAIELNAPNEPLQTFFQKPSILGAGRVGLGLARAITAPLTGATEGFVGEPVKEISRFLGVSPQTSENIKSAAEIFTGFVAPGAIVAKNASKINEANPLTGFLKDLDLRSQIRKDSSLLHEPSIFPKNPSIKGTPLEPLVDTTTIPILPGPLRENLVQEIVNAAEDGTVFTNKNINPNLRVTQTLADLIKNDDIHISQIPGVAVELGLSSEQVAGELISAASHSGKTLNFLSRARKQLNKSMPDFEASMTKLLEKQKIELPELNIYDKLWNFYRKTTDTQRALMVSSLATTARNFFSQGAVYTLAIADEALQGAIRLVISGDKIKKGDIRKEMQGSMNLFTELYHTFTKKGRDSLNKIMDDPSNLVYKAQYSSRILGEVLSTNKIVEFFNIPNRAQEQFYRRMLMRAKLKTELSKIGLDIRTVNPAEIPTNVMEKAVGFALKKTFANMPKTKILSDTVKAFNKMPVLYTSITPFPKFAGNAIEFFVEHSPLGATRLFKKGTYDKLINGENIQEVSKIISQATLGTMLLESAFHIRGSKFAGNKYYEIKKGNKTADMRSYAPMSMYLLIAEMFYHPEKITTKDILTEMSGIRRFGSHMPVLDLVNSNDTNEQAWGKIGSMLGAYVASFLTPLKTEKNVLSALRPEEGFLRSKFLNLSVPETGSSALIGNALGEILNALPGVATLLPRSNSPFTSKIQKVNSPLYRELLGITVKEKSPVLIELERVNFPLRGAFSTVRNKATRNIMNGLIAQVIEKVLPVLFKSDNYIQVPEPGKRILIKKVFTSARKIALVRLGEIDPAALKEILFDRLGKDKRQLVKAKLVELGKPSLKDQIRQTREESNLGRKLSIK